MLHLSNNLISLEILEDCGFTVSSIKFKGKEILYFPFNKEIYKRIKDLAGIPFLYPYANRLSKEEFDLKDKKIQLKDQAITRDFNRLPIHGFLSKTEQWKIVKKTKDFLKGRFDFSKEWLHYFPFEHTIEYSIYLIKNKIIFEIELKDFKEELPISFGLHPYFLLSPPKDNIKLTIPAKQWIETDNLLIPIALKEITAFFSKKKIKYEQENNHFKVFLNSEFSWDNGFTDFEFINSFAQFKIQQKDYKLILYFGEGFSYCQIYSPKEANFICIEPMISITNAFITREYTTLSEPKNFTFIIEIIT